jgi:hypothetical protein
MAPFRLSTISSRTRFHSTLTVVPLDVPKIVSQGHGIYNYDRSLMGIGKMGKEVTG